MAKCTECNGCLRKNFHYENNLYLVCTLCKIVYKQQYERSLGKIILVRIPTELEQIILKAVDIKIVE